MEEREVVESLFVERGSAVVNRVLEWCTDA